MVEVDHHLLARNSPAGQDRSGVQSSVGSPRPASGTSSAMYPAALSVEPPRPRSRRAARPRGSRCGPSTRVSEVFRSSPDAGVTVTVVRGRSWRRSPARQRPPARRSPVRWPRLRREVDDATCEAFLRGSWQTRTCRCRTWLAAVARKRCGREPERRTCCSGSRESVPSDSNPGQTLRLTTVDRHEFYVAGNGEI